MNLRHTLRALRARLGLTCTILITLALGVGVNTAIFTVVYATFFAPSPYPQPDQLVNVWSKVQGRRGLVSAGDLADWKRRSTVFQDLNAWGTNNFNVASNESPEFFDGLDATPGYYATLGVSFSLGRNFLPEEGEPGKNHVVILTHRLWQHLGGDPKIVGRSLRINGEPHTVVGVIAPGVADRWDWQLTVPLAFQPEQLHDHASRNWLITARLKPGATLKQAQAEMDRITAAQADEFPASNRGWTTQVSPYRNDFLTSDRRMTLWLLLGAVGFLLLIACVNVANLLLAKGVARQREVAIRGALGASQSAIFALFLSEGLVLAIAGGILGVAAGSAMLRGLVAVLPPDALPAEADLRLNLPVLFIMLAAATLAGVVFGWAPAWYASRLDPAAVLKEGGRSGVGSARHRLRRALVVAEFALALPLLAGAGLVIHSMWNLTRVDLGVRTDHILGFYVDSVPHEKDHPDQAKVSAYYRRILESIAATPGVSEASAVSYLPLDIFQNEVPFSIAGQSAYANPSQRPSADVQMDTPGYFQTFGVRILKGRSFTDHDDASAVKVAMVNEAFAAKFLGGVDPIGQRLTMEQVIPGKPKGPEVEWQIVGEFHNVKSRGSREDHPEIDVPFWQEAFSVSAIAVRTKGDPAAITRSIAVAVHSVDSQAALALTRTMDQVHDQVLANDRLTAILFAGFALVALLLAAVGIYGVMAFSVTQRSHEIALRMALGANRNRVMGLVVREGLALAGAGLALGFIGAAFAGRAMQSVLFGVGSLDPWSLGGVGFALLLAALAACILPALRAASVETMQLLKSE